MAPQMIQPAYQALTTGPRAMFQTFNGPDGQVLGRLNVHAARLYIDDDGLHKHLLVNAQGEVVGTRLVTNATALLRYQEWLDIDRTVIESGLQRMVGWNDLRDRNLVHNLGSIGQTISLWETQADMTEANLAMSALTRGEKDTPSYGTAQVPVPIVFKEFDVELRRLEASRLFGAGVDVTGAAIAGRLVAERTERMLFLGASINVQGATIYGYTTHPNRNTVDLAEQWDNPATTGADILDDVQQMLAAARADRYYGPYGLYIPGTYEGRLDDDYRDNDSRTIRSRIMALQGIEFIKVGDFLPDDNVVLVQLTRDVVDAAIAQDVTTVQWDVLGGMGEEFKVMAVWVPRVKADHDGRSGIVHLRPA